jgi:hypothetical protein
MPEFKQYDGVKSNSVAAKFTALAEEHKRRIQRESSRSGADDEEYDELGRLLQGALNIQATAVRLRSELHQHEIEQDRKNAHDDAVIIGAANAGRSLPTVVGEDDEAAEDRTKQRCSGSLVSSSTNAAESVNETMSEYLKAQARGVEDINLKRRREETPERLLRFLMRRHVCGLRRREPTNCLLLFCITGCSNVGAIWIHS